MVFIMLNKEVDILFTQKTKQSLHANMLENHYAKFQEFKTITKVVGTAHMAGQKMPQELLFSWEVIVQVIVVVKIVEDLDSMLCKELVKLAHIVVKLH